MLSLKLIYSMYSFKVHFLMQYEWKSYWLASMSWNCFYTKLRCRRPAGKFFNFRKDFPASIIYHWFWSSYKLASSLINIFSTSSAIVGFIHFSKYFMQMLFIYRSAKSVFLASSIVFKDYKLLCILYYI